MDLRGTDFFLRVSRSVLISDMGVGCIAVGYKKLKLLDLKWCFSLSDWGLGLVAVKCKQLSLDLSNLPVRMLSVLFVYGLFECSSSRNFRSRRNC